MRTAKYGKIGSGFTASCLVAAAMFAAITAHAATYYAKSLGKLNDKPRQSSLTNLVEWCTDQALTTLANPQPVITENDGNTYAFAGALSDVKSSHICTFPAGTHVCFGADGDEVGTSASAFSCNCSSVNITIPSCTIYGIRLTPNDGYAGQLLGNYRLVKTASPIRFGASNLKDGATYGYELAGTFTGDDDVVVSVYANKPNPPTVGDGRIRVKFCGDFSGYKGRFETTAFTVEGMTSGHMLAWFSSETSMGDPTSEMDNAITLRHRGYLRIDEEVAQSSTRGITLDLSEGQHAGLIAHANVRWTLRTPVHGGTTGTLKKVGPGTVVLASAMEATDIVVDEGTLVLSNGVSFTEGTTITVANGATLQNLTHGVQNLTVVTEEGGTYEYPTDAVQFDGTDVTAPLDRTWLTAADRAVLTKPIPIALSQAFTIPFTATNRLAVATFDAAAGFVAEDFIDTTPKSYQRLPTTWFETETENGTTTLYLVARPAIRYLIPDGSKNYNLNEPANWTDGLSPHPGADYYSQVTSANRLRTGGGTNITGFNFLGETFSFEKYISVFAEDFHARELRMHNGSEVRLVNASTTSGGSTKYIRTNRERMLRGVYRIEDSATASAPAVITIGFLSERPDLHPTLIGGGTLKVVGQHPKVAEDNVEVDPYYYIQSGVYPTYINFDAGSFTGQLDFATDADKYINGFVTNGLAFGGPLAEYTSNAVRLMPKSPAVVDAISLTATNDVTVNAANRGWYVTSATLGASNDVMFTFAPPTLTLTTALRKIGGGTLAMGCATIGAGSAFAVEEGYVKALSSDCCTNLELAVSSGAGIMVDATATDPEVAAKGLIAKSILPAEAGGEIAVALDVSGGKPEANEVSVAICTVPAEQADLSDILKVKRVSGFMATLSKDAETYAEEGLVTYRAVWRRIGTRIMIR